MWKGTLLSFAAILSTGCSDFEGDLFDSIARGQEDLIRSQSSVTFDLSTVTPFAWDSVLVVIGNESVPVEGDDIAQDLGRPTSALDVNTDRYYFRCIDGSMTVIETSSSLYHIPAMMFRYCDGNSEHRSWLMKDQCRFVLETNCNEPPCGTVFLLPECP